MVFHRTGGKDDDLAHIDDDAPPPMIKPERQLVETGPVGGRRPVCLPGLSKVPGRSGPERSPSILEASWPQQLASGCPKIEDVPLSTPRSAAPRPPSPTSDEERTRAEGCGAFGVYSGSAQRLISARRGRHVEAALEPSSRMRMEGISSMIFALRALGLYLR